MRHNAYPVVTRQMIYAAMVILLTTIFVGAYLEAPPIYLAVGFIGEIILVSTAHLSSMLQQYGREAAGGPPGITSPTHAE